MKISIHPLFYAAMLACALFGGLPLVVIYLVTALLHECGHIFCAERLGFKCEKLKIMPYGAAAVCDIEGIRPRDEIRLALAGPLVNLIICVSLAGLWWFFPSAYAYTDDIMYSNLSMMIVNLLPAYPLDGGKVAGCLLKRLFGARRAIVILKVVAGLVAAGLVALFFVSHYNPTFLFFAAFLVFSAIEKAPKAELVNFSTRGRLRRGMEVKYVLCDGGLTYKDAFSKLDDKKYLVLQLYDGGVADEITQDELYDGACTHGIYDKVFGGDYFSKNERLNIPLEMLPETTAVTHSEASATASSTVVESEP